MTILEARKRAGLSRKSVFELLGIPQRTIEDWESGKREPSPWAEKLVVAELTKIYLIKNGGSDSEAISEATKIIEKNM